MTHLHRRHRGAIVAGTLLASAALAVPAQASFPGKNGPIAYERLPFDGIPLLTEAPPKFTTIWTAAADGTGAKLVAGPRDGWDGDATDPAWSPDARHLAFVRSDSSTERQRIFILDTVTGEEHELQGGGDGYQAAPAWSPNGDQLVYEGQAVDQEGNTQGVLQIAAVDGTVVRDLYIADAYNPQWSPDGKWVAYDSNGWIWVAQTDGAGDPVKVTAIESQRSGPDEMPNWAPDGKAITFDRFGGGNREVSAALPGAPLGDVQVVRVGFDDGAVGPEVVVTDWETMGPAFAPVWSPDGSRILFTRFAVAGDLPTGEGPAAVGPFRLVLALSSTGLDGDDLQDALPGEPVVTGFADWAPAPKPADPAPQQPVTQPAPPAAKPPAQGGVLPAFQRNCVSRRNFTIRLRPRGKKIVRAKVVVAGKAAKVKRGTRWTATVDLRKLPKDHFTVNVTVWTKDGKRFVEARRYWTCTPAKAVKKRG